MSFRIAGLDPAPFQSLFALDDEALRQRGAARVTVEAPDSSPCRISLDDAEPGEELMLLSYEHQPVDGPFRSSGPIFVRKAVDRFDRVDEIPPALARRTLSARAYDAAGMMQEGDLVEGAAAAELLRRWFDNPQIETIHLHYARRGCFAAAATRA
jgi:uncharacterized protein DUF1203